MNGYPEHEHVWVHAPSILNRNLYGGVIGSASRDSRAIWWLTPDDQLAAYQNLQDPSEGKAIFLAFGDPANSANGKDYELFHKLDAWKARGYAGSWSDATEGR